GLPDPLAMYNEPHRRILPCQDVTAGRGAAMLHQRCADTRSGAVLAPSPTSPKPNTSSRPAAPRSVALRSSSNSVAAAVFGSGSCRASASRPATIGAAKEVPRADAYPPPALATATSAPGATRHTWGPWAASGSTLRRVVTPLTPTTPA